MDEKFNVGENSPGKTPSTLWEFALAAYAEPIIQRHCLYLQDHYQMDVNILLAAGFYRQKWTNDFGLALIRAAAPIREAYILPLRALRRQAEQYVGLYGALKTAEIEAERMEIDVLASHIPTIAETKVDSATCLHNLLVYAAVHSGGLRDIEGIFAEMADNFAKIR
jgi:uncharacterized protein (TIGR02444 family)